MTDKPIPMPMSGFCQFPSNAGGSYSSHDYCHKPGCTCPCHEKEES